MLTNTDYVKSGAIWPPRSESERLAEMRTNWELHNGDFKSLFPGAKAPDRLDENDFKLVSRTWRDLMFDRSPALGMADGSPAAPFLEAASSALIAAGRQALINVIRYGVGPVFVRRNTIEAIDPRYWFPVVDLSDEGVRTADVVAYPYRRDPESGPGTADRIRLYILEAGTCRVLDFSFAGAVLGDQQQLDEFPARATPFPPCGSTTTRSMARPSTPTSPRSSRSCSVAAPPFRTPSTATPTRIWPSPRVPSTRTPTGALR